MKNILFALAVSLLASVAWAQPNRAALQKIKQFKKEFITETLALTEADAQAFFLVYDTYEEEKRQLRMETNQLKRGFLAKSDEQLLADLNALMGIKEKELKLEKSYMQQFLNILTPRQVAALYHAESQFRKKLLQRYGEGND